MMKSLLFAVLCALVPVHGGELFYDFEENPAGWKASGGQIERTAERYKSGGHSLKWSWDRGGANLSVEFPEGKVGKTRKGNPRLGFWLYNQVPRRERLIVEVYAQKRQLARFWFNLDFSGWRPLGADYLKLGVADGAKIDRIVLRAPGGNGVLWVDAFKPFLYTVSVNADDQQPWADNPGMLNEPAAKTFYSTHDISLNRPYLPEFVPAEKISNGTLEDIKRLEAFFLNRNAGAWGEAYRSFAELKSEVDELGIREQDGIITGPPLEFANRGFLPVPGALNFKRKFAPAMRNLAMASQRETGRDKDEADEMFLLLCRYMLDQGFQEGNGNLGWIGQGYEWKKFPGAVIAMREVLDKAGLLEPMARSIAYFCCGRQMLGEKIEVSVDDYYNFSSHLAALILMLPEPGERYQRLRAMKRFYDRSIQNDLPFARDGSIHHHWGHHLSYGGYTIPPMIAYQLLPLSGTEFAVAPETVEKLRNYVRAASFQGMHGKLAPNLSLRSGVPLGLNVADPALSVSKLSGAPDPEMAGIYLYECEVGGRETAAAAELRERGVVPVAPSGHLTLNTAAIGIQRRNDWQAAAAAMNNRFRGLEIYGWLENNNYSRYSRNGTLFLSKGGENGWRAEGWNHNFWPGGTNPVFEETELLEGYRNYHSPNTPAGGATLDADGIWGVDFKFMDTAFKKSIFFFDNRITVIATDIAPLKNGVDREMVTTLFQQAVRPDGETPLVNGRETAEAALDGNTVSLLRDSLGNEYYIHPGTPVKYRRGRQEWTYFFKRYLKNPKDNPAVNIRLKKFREKYLPDNARFYESTAAEYDLAYFEHGKNPSGAACAYTVLVDVPAGTLKADGLPAKILQRDSRAHVVYDEITRTTGYVVFDGGKPLPGPLRRIDGPAFVMVREHGDGYRVVLAVSRPEDNREYRLDFGNGRVVGVRPDYPLCSPVVEVKR